MKKSSATPTWKVPTYRFEPIFANYILLPWRLPNLRWPDQTSAWMWGSQWEVCNNTDLNWVSSDIGVNDSAQKSTSTKKIKDVRLLNPLYRAALQEWHLSLSTQKVAILSNKIWFRCQTEILAHELAFAHPEFSCGEEMPVENPVVILLRKVGPRNSKT